LGFSRQSLLEGNQIHHNRQAGIAVENGVGFQIRRNTFARNGHGILLWSKTLPDFTPVVPENMTSYNWQIEENTFLHNDTGIRIAANQDHGIRPLPASGELGLAAPRPHHHTIVRNSFRENRVGIELENVGDTLTDRNEFTGNLETDLREAG
jgi:parallel beta-helix repeat protein